MNNILVTEALTKKYGDYTALDRVSLEIPKNCIYGLLGPNGAGKTTLIRIINQITYPDQGKVFFDGEPLEPRHVAMIGYLPEERGLYKSMKVGDQAMYLARLKGLDKADAKERLKYWFDRLDIGAWWDKKIQELSKGMAQKVQFVVTVLHDPKLLIFDEPFSGFDPINANIIKDEILHLKEKGTSIIFSTHRMESVEELCDYIALIDRSRKILDGKLSDIKNANKRNIFEVGLKIKDPGPLLQVLNSRYQVVTDTYDPQEEELQVRVQVPPREAGDLLVLLSKNGVPDHFLEVVPTVNDIFIQTVEKRESHE